VFADLESEEMVKDGLSAPLHDGAVEHHKEEGWMWRSAADGS
jgi:uncharacterized protein